MNKLKLSKSEGVFYVTDKDGEELPNQLSVTIKDKVKYIVPKDNGTSTSTCIVTVEFLVEVDPDDFIIE
jgi:hypothetical protein